MPKILARLPKFNPLAILLSATVVIVMVIGTLMLTGPQVGSVFSAVTKGLGGPTSATTPNPTAAPASTKVADGLPAERKIIRSATISLIASDVDKTFAEIRALAVGQNGLVFQSSTAVRDNRSYINLTIQVPSASFDEAMLSLHRLSDGKVESENTTGQDVTEEYVDVESQITNLKATEAEFLKLLAKATSVNDVLTVQKELSSVRGEIEKRQGRINFLDKKSDMATIAISIAPLTLLPGPTQPAAKGWDATKVLETAWHGSVKGLEFLFTVLVTVGAWAVWLLPLLGLPYLSFRRLRRRVESGAWPG